jgi:diguanylate cyclase (GGDEF)-like protein
LIVLPQTDLKGAGLVAEHVLAAIQATPMDTGIGTVQMTVSIGASSVRAIAEREPTCAKSLLDLADRCLYKSKNAGRNRVTMPDTADAIYELDWRRAGKALARA